MLEEKELPWPSTQEATKVPESESSLFKGLQKKAVFLTSLRSTLILFNTKQQNTGTAIKIAQNSFDIAEGRGQKNMLDLCKILTIPASVPRDLHRTGSKLDENI